MTEISPTNGHLNGNIFDCQRLLGMETGDIYETISRGPNASQPPSRRGGKTKPNPSMPLSNRRVAKVGSMFITWIPCVGLPSNTPITQAIGYLLNGFQWLISVQLEKHIMGTFGQVAGPGITWIIALSVRLEERNCSETNHGRSYKQPFKQIPASTCPKNTTATILYFKISETHPMSCSHSTNPIQSPHLRRKLRHRQGQVSQGNILNQLMKQDILKPSHIPCHAPVLGVGVLIIEMQLKPRPKGDDHLRTLLPSGNLT